MKICPKCNKEQEKGTVCPICGEKLIDIGYSLDNEYKKKSVKNFSDEGVINSKPSSIKFVIVLVIIFICSILAIVIISKRAKTVDTLISKQDIEKKLDNLTNIFSTSSNTEENATREDESHENRNSNENDEYILPNSNVEYLTEADIAELTLQEINYAKNEIYARHGRRFDSQELMDYFTSKSWYEGLYDPDIFDANYSEDTLNDYEKKNAEFLRSVEYAMNPNGYELDK